MTTKHLPLLILFLVLFTAQGFVLAQSPSSSPSPSASPSLSNDEYRRKLEEEALRHYLEEKANRENRIQASIPHRTASLSAYESRLGWGVLGFGVLLVGLQTLVMLRLQKGWGNQSVRIVGITLVITSGLFLIVTGYSQEQIAPMIGLLGTIIGFLLGKTSKEPE